VISADEIMQAGATSKTHGVRGEVVITLDIDLDWGACRYLVFDIDGIFVPFFIDSVRPKNNTTWLVKFLDIDDEPAAKILTNKTFFVAKSLVEDSDQLALDYFVGFTVIDQRLGTIGTIDAVDESTVNALFAIGDRLMPVCEEFITDIDHKRKILHTNLPEGLLDL
jgi:16S rRNA processing protein RimM